ncbi:beta-lactamase regulating signal transducer with metallopeptidase domain [Sphingomonas jejuensis]|uniref:Beta-lactamase regulating signal transducer with metallopeptidase domain n=1 Tax=Sphingomonas jejuensis TaxID=904715 RepID=A0ABX0XKF8_9SPHN|nr:M56 family metallopeptidase [Sphingomonas jejuensis]NJC33808.1 beta-lactamase regulating signal transducer with metallopeptidase domain [Sphingomonas jejuensis]
MSAWIIETLIATSVLMLLVLAIRGPVAQRFGPRVAYALWLMPALRMIAPPLPAGAIETPLASLAASELVVLDLGGAVPVATAAPIPWGAMLVAVWLGGAALFLLWHLIAYRRFMARALNGARELPMLDRRGIEVCASPAVPGPFAAGIFVKRVVLPADWRRRYDADELRLAMAHEEAHHARADLSANMAALVMVALHWFNPIAHRAHRAFRADQELACDAVVLRGARPDERHAYGAALVKSAIGRRPAVLAPLGDAEDLKGRLKMLGRASKTSRFGGGLVAATVIAGVAVTASGSLAAETGRSMAASTVEAVQAAAAPIAPAAPAAPPAADAPVAPEPPAATTARRAPRVIIIDRDEDEEQALSGLSEEDRAAIRAAGEQARAAGAEARAAGAAAAVAVQNMREGRTAFLRRNGTRLPDTFRVRMLSGQPCRMDREGADTHASTGESRTVICRNIFRRDVDLSTQISALERARESLAATGEPLTAEQRDMALAEIDRALAELRAR